MERTEPPPSHSPFVPRERLLALGGVSAPLPITHPKCILYVHLQNGSTLAPRPVHATSIRLYGVLRLPVYYKDCEIGKMKEGGEERKIHFLLQSLFMTPSLTILTAVVLKDST